MIKRIFKTKEEAERYAITALNKIADLCEELGISFWHGEEDKYDSIYIDIDGYDDLLAIETYGADGDTTAEWLRGHTEYLQEKLEKK